MFYHHDVSMYQLKRFFSYSVSFFCGDFTSFKVTIISQSCLAAPTGICVMVLGLHNWRQSKT